MEKLFDFCNKHDYITFIVGISLSIFALEVLNKEHFCTGSILLIVGVIIACLPVAST